MASEPPVAPPIPVAAVEAEGSPARRLTVVLALAALAVCWGVIAYQRTAGGWAGGSQPVLVLSERLVLAARFCDPLAAPLQAAMLKLAMVVETDPLRLAVIEGRAVPRSELASLTSGYRLLALHQLAPSLATEQELRALASRGLARLNICFLGFGVVCTLALGCSVLGQWGKGPLSWPVNASVPTVLGLYGVWEVLNVFGIGAVLGGLGGSLSPALSVLLSAALSYLGMAALLWRWAGHSAWKPSAGGAYGWVAPGYLLCLFAVYVSDRLVEWWAGAPPPPSAGVVLLFSRASAAEVGALVVLTLLIGPIFEELMFRGWLVGGLAPRFGRASAVGLSALVFALAHGNVAHFPALLMTGGVLGWTFVRSGSVWPAIAVHGMVNATMLCYLFAALP